VVCKLYEAKIDIILEYCIYIAILICRSLSYLCCHSKAFLFHFFIFAKKELAIQAIATRNRTNVQPSNQRIFHQLQEIKPRLTICNNTADASINKSVCVGPTPDFASQEAIRSRATPLLFA